MQLSAKEKEMEERVISRVQLEIKELRKGSTLDEDGFCDEDDKVHYYTGLGSWQLLHVLFTFIQPTLKQRSSLTPFQQLLVMLMRLRLNLSGQDLAYCFQVHSSTIS